ncbi:cell division protein FtsQ [Arthrobacter alpinus]|uniref:Cell division protein FtsQ n=1 Tax=Arthrobacter alpinus TaxID=656366 RepID=A0A1H5GMD8_9MICC|nr:cell division protein FtsQ/DivIB [Arthrobacter alpinus]SEE16922.1 cell division protein FtsQ [Arthrobacter alpinus]
MAEARKPRVIKTRPGISETPAGESDSSSAAVRSTSSKVSVAPLTDVPDEKPAARKFSVPRPGASRIKEKTEPKQKKAGAKAAPAQTDAPVKESGDGGATVLAFPMPEHKRRRRNILYSVAGVAAVLALVMGMAMFSPVLGVRTVVFDGQKLVGEGTLQLAVAPLINKPLPQIRESEVQELLGTVVQVKSSSIEARPPSTLVVHIVERVPVALLKNGEDYLLVDQDGVQLGSTKDPASALLPLIDGGTAAIGQDTFQAMTAVLANLPQSILSQLANATAKSPDAVELALADGRSVVWGNASDMELKAQVLEALLTAPMPTAEPGKPAPVPAKVFDVSAPRHPVTR